MRSDGQYRTEQRGVAIGMAAAAALAALVTVMLVWLRPFALPDLPTAEARVVFTAQIDVLLFVWLGASIADVARRRFTSESDIGGSAQGEASAPVRRARAVVQNTLEQACSRSGPTWHSPPSCHAA